MIIEHQDFLNKKSWKGVNNFRAFFFFKKKSFNKHIRNDNKLTDLLMHVSGKHIAIHEHSWSWIISLAHANYLFKIDICICCHKNTIFALFSAHVPISATNAILKYMCTSTSLFPQWDIRDPLKIRYYPSFSWIFSYCIDFV